jgi:hypothetical protein
MKSEALMGLKLLERYPDAHIYVLVPGTWGVWSPLEVIHANASAVKNSLADVELV